MYFHFETTKKYTASLLSLFNNLEYKANSDFFKVPIQELNREKSDIYSQWKDSETLTRNTQILPRMGLVFNSIEPAREREKIKFHRFNKKIDNKTISFQYNSIPYNFNYQIVLQARGMNQASMIYEQVASFFNPSYCLRIYETPIQDEPTSLILNLNSIDIENSEYSDESLNIVTITFDLQLKGNIYPAIRDSFIVNQIEIYLNSLKNENEFERDSKIKIIENEKVSKKAKKLPFIKDIEFKDGVFECIFDDGDSKDEELRFIWNSNLNEKIAFNANKAVLNNFEKYKKIKINCQIIDFDNTLSNFFEKEFIL